MEHLFDKDDIGKRVLLELDPEQSLLAKALGASKVEVEGKILEVTESYIKVETTARGGGVPFGRGKRTKSIPYSQIKDYEFL